MSKIQVLHTGDLHIDTVHHGRTNPATGIDVAMESNLEVVRSLVATAVGCGMDVFAISGDGFSTGRPSPQAILMLDAALAPLRDAGIPILWTEGNHERINSAFSGLDSPATLMGRLVGAEPATEIELRQYEGVDILAVPYPSKPRILSALGQTKIEPVLGDALVVSYVLNEMERLVAARTDTTIPLMITGHFTVDGIGLPGSEHETANLFSEPIFPVAQILALGADYVGLSHIHTPQKVKGIYYAGSPNKLTFTDAGDTKSANVAIFENGKTTVGRMVTPTRGLYRLRLDKDEILTNAQLDDVFQIVLAEGEIEAPPEIRKELRESGARYVVKRTPKAREKPKDRITLSRSLTPRAAVSAFLASKGWDETSVERQLALADSIGAGL